MMRAGIDISHSIDTMVASDNSDMFALLRTTMIMQRGRLEDPTIYTPEQVLKQGTMGGARALGLDKVTGSITPGKKADIILIRTDDLNMAPRKDRWFSPLSRETSIQSGSTGAFANSVVRLLTSTFASL
jgi:5-methylthioadenosine/S-adenosylhomocysteine deaminase